MSIIVKEIYILRQSPYTFANAGIPEDCPEFFYSDVPEGCKFIICKPGDQDKEDAFFSINPQCFIDKNN